MVEWLGTLSLAIKHVESPIETGLFDRFIVLNRNRLQPSSRGPKRKSNTIKRLRKSRKQAFFLPSAQFELFRGILSGSRKLKVSAIIPYSKQSVRMSSQTICPFVISFSFLHYFIISFLIRTFANAKKPKLFRIVCDNTSQQNSERNPSVSCFGSIVCPQSSRWWPPLYII